MRVRLKSSAVLQDFVASRKGDTALKQKCLLESQARMALNATTATTPRETKTTHAPISRKTRATR